MKPIVIIARLVLLLVAAAATIAAFAISRRLDRPAPTSSGPYACPMHPEATSRAPGDCPICRMALERVSASTRGASGAAAEPDSFWFPESGNQPTYKLIAGVTRRVFTREVRAPAWREAGGLVVAVLYQDELVGLAPGERGLFSRASAPSETVAVRLTAEPPARWDASTSRVRFRVDPGASRLERVRALGDPRPPEVGWVTLAARSRELLAVPSSAVLSSAQGPFVLVASPDGRTLTRRFVEIGQVIAGQALVSSGLGDQERVVVGNAFFLDAERRLKSEREEMAAVIQ